MVGVLHRRGAAHEEEVLEDAVEERVLAEDAEGGGVRARDPPGGVGEEDAIGERDERLLERDLVEDRGVARAATGDAAPLRLRGGLILRVRLLHDTGIRRRTRVPWPGLESKES